MPQPDWQELLRDRIAMRRAKKPLHGVGPNQRKNRTIGINVSAYQWQIIALAAESESLSLAAYMRRATLALAAHDLHMPAEHVFEDEKMSRTAAGNWAYVPFEGVDRWRVTRT